MADAMNQHKAMAMGTKTPTASGTGSTPKYAKGGKVSDKDAFRALDSSQKQPLPKATGFKIATMKKGGGARGR